MKRTNDFSRLTVVSVTGERNGAHKAVSSLIVSLSSLPGAKGLLIATERPSNLPGHIDYIGVKPFGYLEYSIFMLYNLDRFITTDYALIVQPDGWVLDSSNWTDDFLEYDYIGAPSIVGMVKDKSGNFTIYNSYIWQDYMNKPDIDLRIVYNGGFSLRSKKLLAAPRELGLQFSMPAPEMHFDGQHYSMNWDFGNHAEDCQLCIYMRESLENIGIKFAPIKLARLFSIEYIGTIAHENLNFNNVFGIHGRFRTLVNHSPKIISTKGYEGNILSQHRQIEINDMLIAKGYAFAT